MFYKRAKLLTSFYTWEVTNITIYTSSSGKVYNGHHECPYQLLQTENSGVFD
jgi:hypothetical protein